MTVDELEKEIINYKLVGDQKIDKSKYVVAHIELDNIKQFIENLDIVTNKDIKSIYMNVANILLKKIAYIKDVYIQDTKLDIVLDMSKEDIKLADLITILDKEVSNALRKEVNAIASKYWRLFMQKYVDWDDEQEYRKQYDIWKSKKDLISINIEMYNVTKDELEKYIVYRKHNIDDITKMIYKETDNLPERCICINR